MAASDERRILERIARIGDTEADSLSAGDAAHMLGWLRHPSAEVRLAAAGGLQAFDGSLERTRAIIAHLASEASPEVKAAALDTLAFFGGDAQREAEIVADEDDPDYEADTPLAYDGIRQALLAYAADELQDDSVRAAAIKAMGELSDDPTMRAGFLPYLHASQPGLLVAALTALGYSGDSEDVEERVLELLDHPDPSVRLEAMVACGFTRLSEAAERIRPLLDAPDVETRGAALIGFAGAGPLEEAAELLERIGASPKERRAYGDDYENACLEMEERVAELEEPDEEWEEDEEDSRESAEAVTAAFLDDERARGAGEEDLDEARFVARNFQEYVRDHLDLPLAHTSPYAVQDYLLHFYPEKVTVPLDAADTTPETLARFLRYLGRTGVLEDAEDLADRALRLAPQFSEAVRDPDNWSPVKGMAMAAVAAGVDLADNAQVDAFMARMREAVQERLGVQTPYRRETPKVGRNDPCPCGSGKKHKRCCGR